MEVKDVGMIPVATAHSILLEQPFQSLFNQKTPHSKLYLGESPTVGAQLAAVQWLHLSEKQAHAMFLE
jgi:hypothetical protein